MDKHDVEHEIPLEKPSGNFLKQHLIFLAGRNKYGTYQDFSEAVRNLNVNFQSNEMWGSNKSYNIADGGRLWTGEKYEELLTSMNKMAISNTTLILVSK